MESRNPERAKGRCETPLTKLFACSSGLRIFGLSRFPPRWTNPEFATADARRDLDMRGSFAANGRNDSGVFHAFILRYLTPQLQFHHSKTAGGLITAGCSV